MTLESAGKPFPTTMLEAILDQDCLDSGMTLEELAQAKVVAEIEADLVAAGRPIKEIYAEWEEKTPAQIIAKYAHHPAKSSNTKGESTCGNDAN